MAFNFSSYFSSDIDPLEECFQNAVLGNTISVHKIIAHYNSGSHLAVCFPSLSVEMIFQCYFWFDKKKKKKVGEYGEYYANITYS